MPILSFPSISHPAFARIALLALCFQSTHLVTLAADAPDPELVVNVSGGKIRGSLLPDNHGAVFKGIPFAQPPVGNLRWREPQPVTAWSGVREAVKSGPPAAQASSGWNERFA